MLNKCIIIFLIATELFIFTAAPIYAGNVAPRNARIDWEEVEDAFSYRVRIYDLNNKNVIDKTVETNYIDFTLSPGKYKISIGAINKFYKVDSWSDWSEFEIVTSQEPKKIKHAVLEGYALRFGVGIPFYVITSDWKDIYSNSFKGVCFNTGYRLGKIGFIANIPAIRYSGIEIDGAFVSFDGKKAFNRIESDLDDLMTGCNIFFVTDFNFPVNLFLRSGGGLVYTKQNYQKYDIYGSKISSGVSITYDPYYKAGISAEILFYKNFYIETGADYYVINYLIKDFTAIKFFILLGMRI